MSTQWYVASEGQQLGPYTGEQLVQFGQEGRIVAETMVWAEGMAEWVPASQVEGLIPAPVAVAVAAKPVLATSNWAPPGATARPAALAPAAAASPYAPPRAIGGPAASPMTADGSYPYFPIKQTSFGLWLWCLIGCMLSMILAGAIMSTGQAGAGTTEAASETGTGIIIVAFCLIGAAMICATIHGIYSYIILYRAWSCLRYGAPRTTPGAAIGLMFVPFFNMYWIFQAYKGLATDWNRIVQSYPDLQPAPRLSEGVFLTFCIGFFIPFLNLIMIFPVTAQMCKGINFFASRRNPNTPSGSGLAGFGGIKFG